MRAALIGAAVATVVATLANDSGALLLEIGAAYLLVFLGWAWAEGGDRRADRVIPRWRAGRDPVQSRPVVYP